MSYVNSQLIEIVLTKLSSIKSKAITSSEIIFPTWPFHICTSQLTVCSSILLKLFIRDCPSSWKISTCDELVFRERSKFPWSYLALIFPTFFHQLKSAFNKMTLVNLKKINFVRKNLLLLSENKRNKKIAPMYAHHNYAPRI